MLIMRAYSYLTHNSLPLSARGPIQLTVSRPLGHTGVRFGPAKVFERTHPHCSNIEGHPSLATSNRAQVSFGPIAWLLVGELFPLAIRNSAIAVATFTNFGSNSLVAFVLPSMRNALGTQATYAVFGFIGIIAVGYIAT